MKVFHFIQSSGAFHEVDNTGDTLLGVGYAGRGIGVNSPAHDGVKSVGPLPDGIYIALRAREHQTLGPVAIPLEPSRSTAKRGRSGFYIHGDNSARNRSASSGCIILPRHIRERIDAGSLIVVSEGV